MASKTEGRRGRVSASPASPEIVLEHPLHRPLWIDLPAFIGSEMALFGVGVLKFFYRLFCLDLVVVRARNAQQKRNIRRAIKAHNRVTCALSETRARQLTSVKRGRGRPSGSRDKKPRKRSA